jgi:hypothetical protein
MFSFFKKPKPQSSKPSLEGVDLHDLHLTNIPGAVEVIDGFPRVHWKAVRQASEPYANHPAVDQIWTELAAQWLGIVARRLGEPYQIYESNHLLLLSAQAPGAARNLLKIGDAAYDRLTALIHQNDPPGSMGKHAVLMLGTRTIYYDYISYFYSESDHEYGTSSGVHVSRGYRHTAINGISSQPLRTLVHELAHEMVFERPLPPWLNEGLAQFAEDLVPGYRAPIIDGRQGRLHRRYWAWFGIDHFWDGRGFLRSSSQRVSYQLAEILFRNLVGSKSRSKMLRTFLATAHRQDYGEAASMVCFGCSLSALAEEFLGAGSWEPNPKAPEISENA